MKLFSRHRGFVLLLALPALIAFGGCSLFRDEDHEVPLGAGDSGRTVEVERGDVVVVALESNASTGFAWRIETGAAPQLKLKSEEYVPPKEQPTPIVGAPGTQVFRFEAEERGTAVLELAYARSDGTVDRTWKATIRVK